MIRLPAWLNHKLPALPGLPDSALRPLGDTLPCGPSLEYDNDFAVLQSRMRPRTEVQYGDFVQPAVGPDWGEVEREAQVLLTRSRDIQVLLWYTRARTQRAGAAGLLEGMHWLLGLLQTWPEQVHPQLIIDGEHDAAVRANALSGLVDPEGLLSDVRQLVISGGSGTRLTVRDVERAMSRARPTDAAHPEAIQRQLNHLRKRGDATLQQLATCARICNDLHAACRQQMGADAPDLSALTALLSMLEPRETEAPSARTQATAAPKTRAHDTTPAPSDTSADTGRRPPASPSEPAMHAPLSDQREHVRLAIQEARRWIEENEPSSPVAVLLKQAERLLGKRFSEVAQTIPPDLLALWDQD